jgi:putative addiction module component (TIGR02574 family)
MCQRLRGSRKRPRHREHHPSQKTRKNAREKCKRSRRKPLRRSLPRRARDDGTENRAATQSSSRVPLRSYDAREAALQLNCRFASNVKFAKGLASYFPVSRAAFHFAPLAKVGLPISEKNGGDKLMILPNGMPLESESRAPSFRSQSVLALGCAGSLERQSPSLNCPAGRLCLPHPNPNPRALFGCFVDIYQSTQYSPAMSMTVEQIADAALSLPSEARALLADRLVESLDPAEDGYIQQLWAAEALRRRDDVRSGRVKTIPSEEALARVRRAVAR